MTASRLERLLPWACITSAGVLFASELMVLFELTPQVRSPSRKCWPVTTTVTRCS